MVRAPSCQVCLKYLCGLLFTKMNILRQGDRYGSDHAGKKGHWYHLASTPFQQHIDVKNRHNQLCMYECV